VAYLGRSVGKALMDEGLCPANARLVELVVPADGAVVLRYELYVGAEDLAKLARAIARLVTDPGETYAKDRLEQ
jgi:hypothetical protein